MVRCQQVFIHMKAPRVDLLKGSGTRPTPKIRPKNGRVLAKVEASKVGLWTKKKSKSGPAQPMSRPTHENQLALLPH
ncbi:hypothetical protein CCACVL1_06299 [Corchorus capsularis]|uniref:Uncharacterized protein n=1 Tax=Corchorus capsularis TaxID=210143 RepID=A0A1R3JGB3_COCAP|nr:hypothetical protein CCACVL1_06299 [Corchorus capsularis]